MKTQAAAIEFGTSKVVTVFAESGGFARCEIIGSGTVYYDGYKGGVWNRPDLLGGSRRAQFHQRRGVGGRKRAFIRCMWVCRANISRSVWRKRKLRSIPRMSGWGTIRSTPCRTRRRISCAWLTYRRRSFIARQHGFSVDGGKHTMSILGVRGKRLRASVSFILADPAFMEDICELLSMLGITVMGFMAPVLGQTLLMLPLEERDRSCILIDAGYLNTEITVAEGDAAVYHAVLPLGGETSPRTSPTICSWICAMRSTSSAPIS